MSGIKKRYTAKSGDRITRIARAYGVSVKSIVDATPNVFTAYRKKKTNELVAAGTLDVGEMLFYPGEILNIPKSDSDKIAELLAIKADSEDELTIYIDGKKIQPPGEFTFTEYFSSCSDSFSLMYPYDNTLQNSLLNIDPNNFLSDGLPEIKIYIGSEVALTGEIEIPAFRVTASSCSQTLAGRSKTFLLEKSDMLPSLAKEYTNLTLESIVEAVASAYGLDYEVQDGLSIDAIFPKAACEDSENPFTFLTRLSKERACLIGKTGEGNVYIMKAVYSDPVANFDIDSEFLKFIGVESLDFSFDTTKIYGQYIGNTTGTDDVNITATVQSNIILQQSCKITDYNEGTSETIQSMTIWEEQKSVREFYNNSIPYPSWLNPKTGERWKAGQFIIIRSAQTAISDPVVMMIESVEFTDSSGKRTATLNLVPEGTYVDMPNIINNKKTADNDDIITRLGIESFGINK